MRGNLLAAILILASPLAAARADLIITMPSATPAVGANFTLDVQITNTGVTAQNLATFGMSFAITPNVATGVLQFANPQSLANLNVANYVFFGTPTSDSFNFNNSIPLGPPDNPPTTMSVADASQSAFDGGFSGTGGLNLGAGASVIIPIDFDAVGGAPPPQAGDVFNFSVDPASVTFADNNALTGITFDSAGSTLSGTITFEPTDVPEPSSLALCGMVAAGAFGYWRRRKQTPPSPTPAA